MTTAVDGRAVSLGAGTPPRRPWSVRRTLTIDMTWPDGPRGALLLHGRARDLLTREDQRSTAVLAEQTTRLLVAPDRNLAEVAAQPSSTSLGLLVGAPAVSGLRRRLAATLPDGPSSGTLLHQLLDDTPGATIVSDFALRMWSLYREVNPDGSPRQPRRVLGVCTGFRDGSSGLNPDGTSTGLHHVSEVQPLPGPEDDVSWHDYEELPGVSMRRARRIDVYVDPRTRSVGIDSMFQDSSTTPAGGRAAVHQYEVRATAEPDGGRITSVTAIPGNLPYDECPLAGGNVGRLVGTRLDDLRRAVTSELKGVAGCTHLNDALRALNDVPSLLGSLERHREPAR